MEKSPANLPDSTNKPAGFGGFWKILKESASAWLDDNVMRLSAALSLYAILSLAPMLVVSLKIIAIFWRDKASAQSTFMNQITQLTGSSAADAIRSIIEKGSQPGKGVLATIISLAVLFFSASGVFGELQSSMNTIWGVKPRPHQGIWGFVRSRFLSMAMVLGIAFLLLVSMFVSTLMTTMAQSMAGDSGWLYIVLEIGVSVVVITILFAAIFKFLPDVKVKWGEVWLGAGLTSLMFMVGKYALSLYFKYGTPTSAFGAAGSLVAVLLWVYYSAFILFFGAEFTKIWSIRHGNRVIPDARAERVDDAGH